MRNFILKIRATPRQTLFLWSLLLAVFGTGIAFRSLWLANIPGINGDEAWYGAQLRDLPHFTWHTPSGNIVDPFHMLPLALSQFLFPSGFLALRLPSLLSGLLLIGLGWLIFRKSLSPTVALIFALLVAGSPDLIAYSRFGWDASHTGLATLFVMYFMLNRQWALLLLAQICAVVIHPTNIFLVAIWGPYLLYQVLQVIRAKGISVNKTWIAFPLVLVLMSIFLLTRIQIGQLVASFGPHLLSLFKPKDLLSLLGGFVELLDGTTVYRYIIGPVSATTNFFHLIFVVIVIVPVVIYGNLKLIRRKDFRGLIFLAGIPLAIIALYLVSGIRPFQPSAERYSQFLMIPTIILVAISLEAVVDGTSRQPSSAVYLALMIAGLGLLSFWVNYFTPVFSTGGQSQMAFRTAPVEPKQQVADILINDGMLTGRAHILAEDYWLAMPLRYLFANQHHLWIDIPTAPRGIVQALTNHAYVVGFSGMYFQKYISAQDLPFKLETWVITDYANKPLIIIWHRPAP